MDGIDITGIQNDALFGIKNPFSHECVTDIDIHLSKTSCISVVISFRNGNTTGYHEISAFSSEEANEKFQAFINSLPQSP